MKTRKAFNIAPSISALIKGSLYCICINPEIVNNIKNIAHLLDMKTVIEGVETEEQFNTLSEIGCDYFQGYYFSKPVPLDELKKALSCDRTGTGDNF